MSPTTRLLSNTALVAIAAASLSGNAKALTNPCPPAGIAGILTSGIWNPCPADSSPMDRFPWKKPRLPCGCIDLPF